MTSPAATEPASSPRLADVLPPAGTVDADAIFTAFLDGVARQGLELYPAQEQAILELMSGKHVILATPTGSGKSLVATALEFKALAEGKRAYYTCPIKALVSEKFFAACRELGAQNVGMLTGDASINPDAPIVCCTAEILSNTALRDGEEANLAYVIMDEFHYYSDRDRGAAWQVPLLALPQATFLLMSATLGDTEVIERSIQENTGREVALVRSDERPVPLDFEYREAPLHETIDDLIRRGRAPVYLVNFTQRDAAEQAQNLMSVDFLVKEDKARIAEAVRAFRFDTPYGRDMQRFIRHGVGLHHAGLLPKYRLLVEQLSQRGLLKVVSGTDTLGVGVNIPIRTVLFTQLCKFDGQKTGLLSVRDFKQVAGRAGRKGFDERGWVVCQAPEHVIENKRMEQRAEGNPHKKKKLVKKRPPDNFVPWDEKLFLQLVERLPEPLESRFTIDHGMLLTCLQRPASEGGGYGRIVRLIAKSHETERAKSRHRRRAALLFRSLRTAGIVSVIRNRLRGARVVIDEELQRNFSLNQTLSLYLLDALELLDPASQSYAMELVTLVESILENPRVVLQKQLDVAKGRRIAELKAAGVEYEQRMEELEKVEYPKPSAELIYASFDAFSAKHPWVGHENIRPKSIARELYERCATFTEYVREYGLERSEGVLLRYLSDFYRTLMQTVPVSYVDDAVHDVKVYFRTLLARVDDSLVREWEELVSPSEAPGADAPQQPRRVLFDPASDPKGFAARVRAELHQLVRALAEHDFERASELVRADEGEVWDAARFEAALAPFFAERGKLLFDHQSRLPHNTLIQQLGPRAWRVQQVLRDPSGEDDWAIEGEIVLGEASEEGGPLVGVRRVGN